MAKTAPKVKKPAAKAKSTEKPEVGKVAKPAKAAAKPAAKEGAAKAAKAPAKKAPAKGARRKATRAKGNQLQCDACGLVVTIDEECGCAMCDIICCGEEMTPRR